MEALVQEHYALVARFCMRRLGPDHGPDAAQETFVQMTKAIKRYREDARFETWLLGIAHNICRREARRRKKEIAVPDDWIDSGISDSSRQIVDREALKQALSKLSEEHREAVLLHEVEGLKYREIADLLGVPEGTVKSRIHHAFQHLRSNLKEAWQ